MYQTAIQKKEGRKSSLFGPIVLVGIGVLLLLNNIGVLDLNFWELIFRFWPLFLVAAGLDLLLGRRAGAGALIAMMLIVGMVMGGIWLGYVESATFDSVQGQTISQAMDGAERARIDIETSVSQMRIDSAPETSQLIEGAIAPHNNEKIQSDFKLDAGTAYYSLKSDSRGFILPSFGRHDDGLWSLRLNQQTPLDLHVATGVGSSILDLEDLTLTGLDVDTGVGQVEITLPGSGVFKAAVNGGVGEIVILIPETLAARITASAGIGSVKVDGDYMHDGDEYTSPNYEASEHRVDLKVDGGIGSIVVRQIAQHVVASE